MEFARASIRRFLDNRDGSTSIEAAVCIPIILMMIFASIQYGIFFSNSSKMNRVMDDNMRQATILNLPTQADIEQLIDDTLPEALAENIEYNVELAEQFDKTFAQVNVTYSYSMNIPFLDNLVLKSEYKNFMLLADTAEYESAAD